MRHIQGGKNSGNFCEPFWPGFDLSSINGLSKHLGVRIAALCLSTLFLSTVAKAELQLQRLYTAPNIAQRPTFLLQGNDGNYYGTMANAGYVFKMTPSGAVTIFPPLIGLNPELALGEDGNIYGSVNGQPFGGNTNGYIFKINLAGQVTIAFAFDGANGAHPIGMRKGIDGSFYGVMGISNANRILPKTNHITIFQFTINGTLTNLYSVTNGPEFISLPVQGSDGNLYGTTFSSGIGFQPPFGNVDAFSVYRLSTNGDFQTIYIRSNALASSGELIFGADNSLYGTIASGVQRYPPTLTYGSIFRVTTNGAYSSLFSFSSTNGSDPEARLLAANDGYIYGSTYTGGISNRGTLFRISVQGEFTSLLDFKGANGSNPNGPLVQAGDGNLYGVTESSTVTNIGTIYRLVQPTMISNFGMANGGATLTWNSFPNGIYRVEYKSALADPSWVPLIQRVTAMDQTITVFDNATEPQRLYRVVLLP
jgi:uncharacterized repeat protein (TIGR03803 family)